MLEVIAIDEKFTVLDKYGEYLISNYGRCYSVKSQKFLKANLNSNGYARFHIMHGYDNNKKQIRQQVFVHLAVVEHFGDKFGNTFEEKSNYIEKINVDHRNGNRLDNRQSNLQIVSAKCNQQRKYLKYEDIDNIENYNDIEDIF